MSLNLTVAGDCVVVVPFRQIAVHFLLFFSLKTGVDDPATVVVLIASTHQKRRLS